MFRWSRLVKESDPASSSQRSFIWSKGGEWVLFYSNFNFSPPSNTQSSWSWWARDRRGNEPLSRASKPRGFLGRGPLGLLSRANGNSQFSGAGAPVARSPFSPPKSSPQHFSTIIVYYTKLRVREKGTIYKASWQDLVAYRLMSTSM